MAEQPIGITFLPSADAAANGPRQAGIEGQGGSDLTQAFKILSLHLPRVLGAAAIAPKRLLTSPGAAGLAPAGGGGSNPYSAVFESLLRQLTGGGMSGGPSSLSSLYGNSGSVFDAMSAFDTPGSSPSGLGAGGVPVPRISPADEPTSAPPITGSEYGGNGPSGPSTASAPIWAGGRPDDGSRPRDRYI